MLSVLSCWPFVLTAWTIECPHSGWVLFTELGTLAQGHREIAKGFTATVEKGQDFIPLPKESKLANGPEQRG